MASPRPVPAPPPPVAGAQQVPLAPGKAVQTQTLRFKKKVGPRSLRFSEAVSVCRRMIEVYNAQVACKDLMNIRNYPGSAGDARQRVQASLKSLGLGDRSLTETDYRDMEHYVFNFFVSQVRGLCSPRPDDFYSAYPKLYYRVLVSMIMGARTIPYSVLKKVWQELDLPDTPIVSLNGAKTSAPDIDEVKIGLLGAHDGAVDGTPLAQFKSRPTPPPSLREGLMEIYTTKLSDFQHEMSKYKPLLDELIKGGYLSNGP